MNASVTLNVLHLDDDPFELERVQAELSQGRDTPYAMAVHSCPDVAAFVSAMQLAPDVIILDMYLGQECDSGLALVPLARRAAPDAVVLMHSAGDEAPAVESALVAAVDDFVGKDTEPGELRRIVIETYERRRRQRGAELAPRGPGPAVAGRTLRALEARIPALVQSAVTGVHVAGESGTGKEVVASLFKAAAHPRPFLSVNCGAIAPSLLESSLFGVARGSFTGASADRKGYLEEASGGWLFLDEIACLSLSAQAALLRAIENQEIMRVGDSRPVAVDVRVISATNEDLRALVAAGRFRQDLWQRLSEVELVLPALRDRRSEIPELIDHLLLALPGGPYRIASGARKLLNRQPWREGNVRQLRNCLRAMTERHTGGLLTPQSIPPQYRQAEAAPPSVGEAAADAADAAGGAGALRQAAAPAGVFVPLAPPGAGRYDYERLAGQLFVVLVQTLGRAHGPLSIRRLADYVGLSKSSISRKLWDAIDQGLTSKGELTGAVRLGSRPGTRPGGPGSAGGRAAFAGSATAATLSVLPTTG